MSEKTKIKSIDIKDLEGDTLSLSIGKVSWIDVDKSTLVFIDNEQLIKLARFILESIEENGKSKS